MTTARGDIRVTEATAGAVVLSTQSGSITIGAAPETAATLDAHTSYGRVSNALRNTEGKGAGLRIQATISHGDISAHSNWPRLTGPYHRRRRAGAVTAGRTPLSGRSFRFPGTGPVPGKAGDVDHGAGACGWEVLGVLWIYRAHLAFPSGGFLGGRAARTTWCGPLGVGRQVACVRRGGAGPFRRCRGAGPVRC
ncbi:hypothetical protein [Streptomyces sp. NPDC057325]|uniref:hypothetical protein n=1 Tax=unclassified Streptomyces TaxID=2593676 RepID=UPI003624D3CC